MTALTQEERACAQEWAVKVQALENKLSEAQSICEQYLEGLLTSDECAVRVSLALLPK